MALPPPQDQPRDQFGAPLPDYARAGSSWSESQSTSTPTYLETPQNAIMDAISRVASGLAQQMLGWANDTYAQTSKITDQAVGNFFQVSQQMSGLSNDLTNQYNDVFAPQNRSLALEADQYNSAARQEVNMGMAGATQAQAGDAALRASEEALRSYGINPADGRYAALDQAARVQNAANVAGAMNMERERTAQVGRDLRRDAVQVGAMLPAAIANTAGVANQANTGASNANLANANTGKALMQLPNDYLNTAMGIKMPISGQNSQSTSSGGSRSAGMGGGASSGGGGGRPSMGGGGGGRMMMPSGGGAQGRAAWMPQHTGYQPSRHGPAFQQGAAIRQVGPYQGQPGAGFTDIDTNWMLDGVDFGQWTDGDYYQPYENYGIGYDPNYYSSDPVQEYGGAYDNWGFDNYDFGSNGWDSNYGGGGDYGTYGNYDYGSDGSYDTGWGNIGYDYSANSYDPGWGNSYDTPVDTDWGSGASAYQDYGYSDWGGSSYDTTSYDSDFYAGDYDTSGDYVYAKGGPVPPKGQHPQGGPPQQGRRPQQRPMSPQGGGRVPPQMSPSGGRRVDDVPAMSPQGPARLNADEFVIPRDVAMWKGQEFFQKLIDQSRQKRVMAPAPGGQPAPQMR